MSQFFADTHTILELDLSKRGVLHRLVPLALYTRPLYRFRTLTLMLLLYVLIMKG